MNIRTSRRRILRAGGFATAAAAVPALFVRAAFASPKDSARWGGFVILDAADSPLPADVILSGVPPILEGAAGNARQFRFATGSAAAANAGVNAYRLAQPPTGGRAEGEFTVVRNSSGELASLSIGYETHDASQNAWVRSVDVTASRIFLRPFPIWPTRIGDRIFKPAEVRGLPAAAVMSASALGHIIRWIERDVLYQLRVENGSSADDAIALAATLVTA